MANYKDVVCLIMDEKNMRQKAVFFWNINRKIENIGKKQCPF